MKDLKNMMGQLQEAQAKAEEAKARLEEMKIIEIHEGLEITINGNRKVLDIKIPENSENLENKLVVLVNKAVDRAQANYEMEMQKSLTNGMNF